MSPRVKVHIINLMAKKERPMKSKPIIERIAEIIQSSPDLETISQRVELLIKEIHVQHPPSISFHAENAVRNFMVAYAKQFSHGDA